MQIEKGIVLPPPKPFSNKGHRTSIYHQMEVGDSIFFPNKKGRTAANLSTYIGAQARSVTKGTGKKFATRSVEGGVRIWRTA